MNYKTHKAYFYDPTLSSLIVIFFSLISLKTFLIVSSNQIRRVILQVLVS